MLTVRQDPLTHLANADPVLAVVIGRFPVVTITKSQNYFARLVESIISQQLSEKAADTILARFLALFKTKTFPTPKQVLTLDSEKIRHAGISYAKISYIKDLAKRVDDKTLNLTVLDQLPNEKVIEYLIQVKGIGRWTAEMFLMFGLGREDIFSFGDLGLRNAFTKLYKLRKPLTEKKALQISQKWKPYRTWACRYLWASLNLKD